MAFCSQNECFQVFFFPLCIKVIFNSFCSNLGQCLQPFSLHYSHNFPMHSAFWPNSRFFPRSNSPPSPPCPMTAQSAYAFVHILLVSKRFNQAANYNGLIRIKQIMCLLRKRPTDVRTCAVWCCMVKFHWIKLQSGRKQSIHRNVV